MTPSLTALVVLAAVRPSRERARGVLVPVGLSTVERHLSASHSPSGSRGSKCADYRHSLVMLPTESVTRRNFPIGAPSADHAGGCRAAA